MSTTKLKEENNWGEVKHAEVSAVASTPAIPSPLTSNHITTKVLSERAVLLHLSIGGWAAKIADEDAKNVVVQAFGSDATRIDAKKCLVDPKILEDVRNAGQKARVWHYKHSLPWMDGGLRLIKSITVDEHCAKLREFRSEWEKALISLKGIIADKLEEGKKALGGLGKDEDYPTADEVMAKFKFSFGLLPVPDKRDIRVELSAEGMKAAQESVNGLVEESTKNIVIECQTRVAKVIEKIIEKLKDKKDKQKKDGTIDKGYAVFRDSLIQNALDMVPLLHELNILDDPAVKKLADDLQTALGKVDVDKIREDETYRNDVIEKATSVLNATKGGLDAMALGGFGADDEEDTKAAA